MTADELQKMREIVREAERLTDRISDCRELLATLDNPKNFYVRQHGEQESVPVAESTLSKICAAIREEYQTKLKFAETEFEQLRMT